MHHFNRNYYSTASADEIEIKHYLRACHGAAKTTFDLCWPEALGSIPGVV